MKIKYRILNGDSLKIQFPNTITGHKIIARLCLVDGHVKGKTLAELFKVRAKFISENYVGYTEQDYFVKTVTEIEKIVAIPKDTEINLWFEDDLFCQVNFWFVANLIAEQHKNQCVYLIRPKVNSPYSFGGMTEKELIYAYQQKTKINLSEIKELSNLWKLYQKNSCDEMLKIAEKLKDRFPFLVPAIRAHKDRLPENGYLGRPKETLIQLMKDLKTDKFGEIFRAFCKREAIYGFGDLQVKRLFDELL